MRPVGWTTESRLYSDELTADKIPALILRLINLNPIRIPQQTDQMWGH